MKKVILSSLVAAVLAVGSTSFAYAENIDFSGTLANACNITVASAGTLALGETDFSTSADAVATVTNNAAGIFNLTLAAPTDWATSPNGYSGSTSFVATFTTAGANAQGAPVDTLALANVGTDTTSVNLSGTSDAVYPAGSYSVVSVLSCNAI